MEWTTKRLRFRRWRETDAEKLYELARDPKIGPAAGWAPHKDVEESRWTIRNILSRPECYAICERGSDSPIGAIELMLYGTSGTVQQQDECELGYWLGRSFWGRGYMSEAAAEMIRYAFEKLEMSRVWCGYYEGNDPSRRVQEKLGFQYHHICRDVPVLGESRNNYINCITREQYERMKEHRTEQVHGALAGERYRVIVTTDIGGTDEDDDQSMVHYLLYSDLFDTEGLISSPWGKGRASNILRVIDCYEQDYPSLRKFSDRYPSPESLRSVTKQGATEIAPYQGYTTPSEASEWIIRCAKKEDPRPLYLLMWGLLDDLAQALHDAPEILPKLRVHYIGGYNKMCGLNAYEYIRRNYPDLWMIEDNSTYRGWFVGGDQTGDWGNRSFVSRYAAGHGALGDYFAGLLSGQIKMGDTPTVAWLLKGNSERPVEPGWGGRFVRVGQMPGEGFRHPMNQRQQVEMFEAAELILAGPEQEIDPDQPVFTMYVRDVPFQGYYQGRGEYRVRFLVREPGEATYRIKSRIPELDGLSGSFTAVPERQASREGTRLKNWWSDMLDPEYAEGIHRGARWVNAYRREFLQDFAERFERCGEEK